MTLEAPSPRQAGMLAFAAGLGPLDNPYFAIAGQERLFDAWCNGWLDANAEAPKATHRPQRYPKWRAGMSAKRKEGDAHM